MDKGIVYDIQRFSIHDGPGIRTTVFLKGCPLSCAWCHNPEGKILNQQVRFFENKCIGCGECVSLTGQSPADMAGKIANATEIGASEICPSKAFTVSGNEMTSGEVLDAVMRDIDFYGKDGGVTFSGGEPLFQLDFLLSLLKEGKTLGLNTVVDTCGYAPFSEYEKIIPYTDLFLYDIKCVNQEKHEKYTGCSNAIILENFPKLLDTSNVWVRIPIIPRFNSGDDDIKAIISFLKPYKDRIGRITLIPYHNFGNVKYKTLGMQETEFTEPENIDKYEEIFRQQGFNVHR